MHRSITSTAPPPPPPQAFELVSWLVQILALGQTAVQMPYTTIKRTITFFQGQIFSFSDRVILVLPSNLYRPFAIQTNLVQIPTPPTTHSQMPRPGYAAQEGVDGSKRSGAAHANMFPSLTPRETYKSISEARNCFRITKSNILVSRGHILLPKHVSQLTTTLLAFQRLTGTRHARGTRAKFSQFISLPARDSTLCIFMPSYHTDHFSSVKLIFSTEVFI